MSKMLKGFSYAQKTTVGKVTAHKLPTQPDIQEHFSSAY